MSPRTAGRGIQTTSNITGNMFEEQAAPMFAPSRGAERHKGIESQNERKRKREREEHNERQREREREINNDETKEMTKSRKNERTKERRTEMRSERKTETTKADTKTAIPQDRRAERLKD